MKSKTLSNERAVVIRYLSISFKRAVNYQALQAIIHKRYKLLADTAIVLISNKSVLTKM